MSTAIHRSADDRPAADRAFLVPGPRATDAVGEALRGAYRHAEALPPAIAACLAALDGHDRG